VEFKIKKLVVVGAMSLAAAGAAVGMAPAASADDAPKCTILNCPLFGDDADPDDTADGPIVNAIDDAIRTVLPGLPSRLTIGSTGPAGSTPGNPAPAE
jgi:hypothetical protein